MEIPFDADDARDADVWARATPEQKAAARERVRRRFIEMDANQVLEDAKDIRCWVVEITHLDSPYPPDRYRLAGPFEHVNLAMAEADRVERELVPDFKGMTVAIRPVYEPQT